MEIKLMSMADYDRVYKLWLTTEGIGLRSLDDSKEGIAKLLNRNPTTNFVAQEENEVIGIILCGHDGRRGYIYHTAVKTTYRGRGIGKALVVTVLNALKAAEINKVVLVAFAANEAGNQFWQAIGFAKRDDLIYRNLSINENNT